MAVPFQGETMCCALCSKILQSDAHVESNWRAIDLDDQRFYVCPKHFPRDNAPAGEFAKAYKHVIKSLTNRRDRGRI
jgi:hypothetical protein